MHHLRTFSCIGHIKNTRQHLKKLDDRSTPMVLLGYAVGSKAYRLYSPIGGRVHLSSDVMFDESLAGAGTLHRHRLMEPNRSTFGNRSLLQCHLRPRFSLSEIKIYGMS